MRARLKHERLAAAVARSRMSQNRWAQKLGLSRGHFSELVNGRRPYPSPRTRGKLLDGLGLEFEQLFELELGPNREDRTMTQPARQTTPFPPPPGRRPLPLPPLRQALRVVLARPAFSAFVVAVLGMGIGLTTAVFSIVNSVLLQPLPYREPSGIVAIFRSELGRNGRSPSSPADFHDYRRELDSLEHLVAAHPWAPVWSRADRSERITGLKATADLFRLLGVAPRLGAAFAGDDDRIVVLGHELWTREFGADPGVVGRSITLDRESYRIAGVMPSGFYFPPFWATEAEFWVPLSFTPEEAARRNMLMLRIFGRLAPGRQVAEARSELDALFESLRSEYPDSYVDADVRLEPVLEPTVDRSRSALWFLGLSAGLVLIVACANVANLLLARTLARRREIATRLALGAGRGRMLAQFLSESALLAVAAGAAGVLLASGLLAAFERIGLNSLPRSYEIDFDWSALLFSGAVSAATALLFGLTPLAYLRRVDLDSLLRAGGRWAQGQLRAGLQRALVVGQLALAVVLLLGAGLFLRSFQQLAAIDPGFKTSGLLTYTLSLSGTEVEGLEQQRVLFEQIVSDVAALPGVSSAGFINHLPIGGDIWQQSFRPEGVELDPDRRRPTASFRTATPGLFATMGIPLLQGRLFDGSERNAAVAQVIVNAALATRYFIEGGAVGRHLLLGDGAERVEIIGVVGDVRQWALADRVRPEIYYSYAENPTPWWLHSSLVVEPAAGRPSRVTETVRRRIWELNAGLAVSPARSIESILFGATSDARLQTVLVAGFAGLGLLLSAAGVYGVLAYLVSRRRHELGLRIALGARPSDIHWSVARLGAGLGLAGLLAGSAAAFGTSRLAATFLYGSAELDVSLLAAVAAVLAAVLLAACWIPARHATRVDPLEVLRAD